MDPPQLDPPVCRDPDDDWVIATAEAGECVCIVTGDADLWSLGRHGGISIVQPREFWEFELSID